MSGTRSYDEVVAARRARLSPEALRYRKVLEQDYDVAMQVIALREKRGLTQAELAEQCGVDQGDISRIERGETSPTTRTLHRIAVALGADVRLVERAS
jgi:ribosome-binding protein aMBF1 (putative translation factor)